MTATCWPISPAPASIAVPPIGTTPQVLFQLGLGPHGGVGEQTRRDVGRGHLCFPTASTNGYCAVRCDVVRMLDRNERPSFRLHIWSDKRCSTEVQRVILESSAHVVWQGQGDGGRTWRCDSSSPAPRIGRYHSFLSSSRSCRHAVMPSCRLAAAVTPSWHNPFQIEPTSIGKAISD